MAIWWLAKIIFVDIKIGVRRPSRGEIKVLSVLNVVYLSNVRANKRTGRDRIRRIAKRNPAYRSTRGFLTPCWGEGQRLSSCAKSGYSNGFGTGVLSVEGGNIGKRNEGWSPVSVLRKATIWAFSSPLNVLPSCSRPMMSTDSVRVCASPSWK